MRVNSMESHFVHGFTSTELRVDNCTDRAQQLVAALPQQKQPLIQRILFPVQQQKKPKVEKCK